MRSSTRGVLVALSLVLFLAAVVIGGMRLALGPAGPAGRSVLTVRLEGPWPDHDANASINELLGVRLMTLRDLVRALDAAAADDDVAGLELRVGSLQSGWGRAQEIRDALLRFRKSGKPVHAFMEEGDDGAYYLARTADRVRLMPSSTLWLDGLSADVTFFGGTLAKAGVQADLEQIGDYKNAADVMKRREMSEAHRESMASLVGALHAELVRGLADSMSRPPEDVERLIDGGPYTASAALEAGLVDALGYQDEAAADLDAALDRQLPRVRIEKYVRSVEPETGGSAIAVVHCHGTIMPGESSGSLLGGSVMGSDTIARALESAREQHVKAVVLRVDSPGGSATASDVIWRETQRLRKAGIPVVVSMSDVAASGGYWISMGADKVLAEPSTLTGSIGIYGGKYVFAGLADRIDMNVENVESGRNADFMSPRQPFTDEQRELLQANLQAVYRLFIERTATGRGFATPDDVDRIARGRVWTGRQALELGLVDGLGGLDDALAEAKRLAGIPADEDVSVPQFPRSPGLLEMLREGGPSALSGRLVGAMAQREVEAALPAALRGTLADAPLLDLLDEGVLAWTPVRALAR